MAALQSRALASAGWHVLQIDLHGCGDSAGEFADAGWDGWLEDVAQATRWLQQAADGAVSLWGLRVGALLASAIAVDGGHNLVLWQPATSGSQYLNQFLRTRSAGSALADNSERTTVKELRERLLGGESVSVGGYDVSPRLGAGLARAELGAPPSGCAVAWLEVSTQESTPMSPAAQSRIAAWRSFGTRVDAACVRGLPFWQTQEIAESAELITETCGLLSRFDT